MSWMNITGKNAAGKRVAHVVPVEDTFEHELDITCWCQPEIDIEDDRVLIHNSHDQRELYETGIRKLM